MNESNFEIVLDVLAREIDMLRFQLKAKDEENEKLRNCVKAFDEENANQNVILFREVCEKHE